LSYRCLSISHSKNPLIRLCGRVPLIVF